MLAQARKSASLMARPVHLIHTHFWGTQFSTTWWGSAEVSRPGEEPTRACVQDTCTQTKVGAGAQRSVLNWAGGALKGLGTISAGPQKGMQLSVAGGRKSK